MDGVPAGAAHDDEVGISIADLLALRQTWDDELANLRAHVLSLRTKIATVDYIIVMARRAAVASDE